MDWYFARKHIHHGDLKRERRFYYRHRMEDLILNCDFGLSPEAGSDKPATDAGSHVWRAPEADGGAIITQKADVFAMGTVLVEILAFGMGSKETLSTDCLPVTGRKEGRRNINASPLVIFHTRVEWEKL
jgi:Protein kinase domain